MEEKWSCGREVREERVRAVVNEFLHAARDKVGPRREDGAQRSARSGRACQREAVERAGFADGASGVAFERNRRGDLIVGSRRDGMKQE